MLLFVSVGKSFFVQSTPKIGIKEIANFIEGFPILSFNPSNLKKEQMWGHRSYVNLCEL